MKKDKGIPLSSPHNPADINSDYLKIFQHVLTRSNSMVFRTIVMSDAISAVIQPLF